MRTLPPTRAAMHGRKLLNPNTQHLLCTSARQHDVHHLQRSGQCLQDGGHVGSHVPLRLALLKEGGHRAACRLLHRWVARHQSAKHKCYMKTHLLHDTDHR